MPKEKPKYQQILDMTKKGDTLTLGAIKDGFTITSEGRLKYIKLSTTQAKLASTLLEKGYKPYDLSVFRVRVIRKRKRQWITPYEEMRIYTIR